ncbi:MAG: hypothetical protein COA78_33600 [Blastopirellula sp.]|nr:MAG: hypothetical protein COA78_33600 [Blastopirellula sp.]
MKNIIRHRDSAYLAMVAPSAILLVIITIIPILATFYISLHFFNPTSTRQFGWVGWENYGYLLEDSRYLNSLRVMLWLIVIPVALQITLGMALAIALKEKLAGTSWMRVLFLLPAVIPPAVSGLVWKLFIVPGAGGVTYMGSLLGIDLQLDLLSSPNSALFVIIVCSTWVGTPFVALLFLSSLETISKDLYEAAHLDGAGWLQSHWSISIPIMRPVIMTVMVFRILEALAIFPIIFILTGGGPAGSTEPVNYYAYVSGFQYLKIDYAATIIVSFFVILMVFCAPFLIRIARAAR